MKETTRADSHGWNRRVGWIVPSWNTVTEYEVARLAPSHVSNHFTRIAHTEDSERAFARMIEEAPTAAELLAHADVEVIGFACTAGSFFRGRSADVELGRILSERVGRPVMTMADSIVRATRHLGVERLSLAAPYEPWLLDLLASYLTETGFNVVESRGLGVQANVKHALETTIELARGAYHPAADGIIISCGNFRTLEAIDVIEEELGIPVVTSIQAAVWTMLTEIDAISSISGPGSLLSGQNHRNLQLTTKES